MNKSSFFSILFSSLISLSFSDGSPLSPEEHPPMDCFPKSCGNVTNITYPFWVEGRQKPYCGFPSFRLSCRNETPYLKIPYGDYQVRDISYENQSVLLLNDEGFLSNSCPVVLWNVSLSSTPFNVSPLNRDLVFLFNCSGPPLNYYQIPCSTPNATFVHWGDDLRSPGSCHSAIMPVADFLGEDDVIDYLRFLRKGFVLNWTAASCTDCTNSHGQCGYNINKDNFMCICPDHAHSRSCLTDPVPVPVPDAGMSKKVIIGVVASVGGALIVLGGCLALFFRNRRKRQFHSSSVVFSKRNLNNNLRIEAFLEEYGSIAPKRYSYSKVKKITKDFQEKLGQGGFGTVFKGTLSDGHVVAVKILKDSKGDGEEFINEVASTGRTSHVNVVSLLGFCAEGSKRALIYDFMCNGSLDKLLNSGKPKTALDWDNLYQITIGIARGLEYLHRGCNTRMVHFDIKPHNILLDQDFCPKISDFGLAKLCLKKESVISIAGARGTIGYIAPEVFSRNFGVVSSKSDVYSYGMMVLEIAGGRKNPNEGVENSSEIYFPHWIYARLDQTGDLLSCGVTAESEETVRKMVLIGLWCIQTMPENRPSMSKVIEMMEGNVNDLRIPPKPYLSSSPLGSIIGTSSILDT